MNEIQRRAVRAQMGGMNGRKPDSFIPGGNNSLQLLQAFGNPPFDAQFDLNVTTKYFTVSGGTYTEIAASALNAALKTKLPVFLFGHTDFAGGFPKLQGQYALTGGWAYSLPYIYGTQSAPNPGAFGALTSTVTAFFSLGDLVMLFSAVVGGVNYVAAVIVHSPQVAYGTLLDALSSDLFYTNLIRYVIADALVAQYSNAIGTYDQTLFGKFKSDSINPNSFKQPDQQQAGIIDIPAVQGIDKNTAWALNVNYDAVFFTLSIFANGVDKLKAS